MGVEQLLSNLTEGTILEGPYWTDPVKGLTTKARGRCYLEINRCHYSIYGTPTANRLPASASTN
jgi:hypothetical protein